MRFGRPSSPPWRVASRRECWLTSSSGQLWSSSDWSSPPPTRLPTSSAVFSWRGSCSVRRRSQVEFSAVPDHEQPRRWMLLVGGLFLDVDEAGLAPGVDRRLVPRVWIDRDTRPTALLAKVTSERPRRIRAESATTCSRDHEHVDAPRVALAPRLQVADRLAAGLDDEAVDIRAPEPLQDLRVRERLVVPVAGNLRIGVPAHQQL